MATGLVKDDAGEKIGGSLQFLWAPSANNLCNVNSLNEINDKGQNNAQAALFNLEDASQIQLPYGNDSWVKFVMGAVWVVQKNLPTNLKLEKGIVGVLYGDIPAGGMSRSASLSINLILSLLEANGLTEVVTMREVTLWAKELENTYIGSPCGNLDQTMIGFGKPNQLTVLRQATGEIEYVSLGPSAPSFSWFVLDTGYKRVDGGLQNTTYHQRSGTDRDALLECARENSIHISNVSELNVADHFKLRGALLEKGFLNLVGQLDYLLAARANFNRFLGAWKSGSVHTMGEILNLDGFGLEAKFVISSPAQIVAAQVARGTPNVLGARMAGGGDGGVVMGLFLEDGTISFEAASNHMLRVYEEHYSKKFGMTLHTEPKIYRATNNVFGVAELELEGIQR